MARPMKGKTVCRLHGGASPGAPPGPDHYNWRGGGRSIVPRRLALSQRYEELVSRLEMKNLRPRIAHLEEQMELLEAKHPKADDAPWPEEIERRMVALTEQHRKCVDTMHRIEHDDMYQVTKDQIMTMFAMIDHQVDEIVTEASERDRLHAFIDGLLERRSRASMATIIAGEVVG